MDWIRAVTRLKAHIGVETDKALYERAGFHCSNLTSIKRGGASFANIEKLCSACGIKPSQFFAWGEKQ